jgi:hypothetical protein
MKTSKTVIWLSSLIAMLALVAAAVGLFWGGGGSPFTFTNVHGQAVQMYGQGLYRYDSRLIGTGYRVQDAVTLLLGIPLLVFALLRYRRGSLKGGLLLAGMLTYFLYNYASMALGAAYNNLFLIYVALFSASLFGLVLALAAFDLQALPRHFSNRMPWRGITIFLIVTGEVLFAVWLFMSILPALIQGQAPPDLGSYTTVITWAMDLGVVGPALIVVGVLLRQRAPVGYLLAAALLVFSTVLGISLAAMGIAQFLAGLFGIGQFIGMVVSFAILALVAFWFTVVLFRNLSDSTPWQAPQPAQVGEPAAQAV